MKSQIHAGGRGKGKFKEASAGDKGGVRLAKSIDEVEDLRPADAGRDAGDGADRPRRQAGQPPLCRGRLRHRQGVLSLGAGRSRDLAHLLRRFDRRRREHRGSRAQDAGEDRDLLGRSGDRHHGPSRPHGRQGAGADRRSRQAGGRPGDEALHGVRRQGHVDAGDQPADHHQAGQAGLPRCEGFVRRQRALSSSGHRQAARRDRRGFRRKSRRRSTS